jgi:tripartite ATP-independent transporter DctM subunit
MDGLVLIFGGFVFFLIVLAVPVPFALGLTALAAVAASGKVPLAAVPIKMVNSVDSFLLIAVPFFILSAELLNTSQITTRIFHFADSLVGHVRGGLGHVNIVGSMIFSGMSGSAVADVAGMGAIEVKAMLDAKYDRAFVAAVTAASAVVGPIIPPSIPAILYGSIAEVSVGKLFMGGVVPGFLMGFAMMGAG